MGCSAALHSVSLYLPDVYLLEVESFETGFGGGDAIGGGAVGVEENGAGGILGDVLADLIA